jgi:hypothetical protein
MRFLDSLGRWARLAGLVGLAVGSLALQACTQASPGDRDAAIDAGADAAQPLDATVPDAQLPHDAQIVDARLWDVICE